MKPNTWWRLAGLLALLAVVGTAAAVTILMRGQAAPLGLSHNHVSTPAPSANPYDPLALACRRPAVPGNSNPGITGLWVTQPGSIAGYQAHEKFADISSPHVAVARTNTLGGWILVSAGAGGVRIETGCVAVDVRTLRSVDQLLGFNTADRDSIQRDMLGSSAHPFVIFQPYPAALNLDPTSTAVQHVQVDGDVQVNGVTRMATFRLDVRLDSGQLSAAGTTTVQVGDFGVQVPTEAGGFVQVDPNVTLEVSLVLLKP